MSKSTLIFSMLLFSLFLSNFSCQDHVSGIAPDLKTLEVAASRLGKCALAFRLEVVSPGNMVQEYGVVFSARGDGYPLTSSPTVANTKVTFDQPLAVGVMTMDDKGLCTSEIYYRTYAILNDASVTYGNLMHISNN